MTYMYYKSHLFLDQILIMTKNFTREMQPVIESSNLPNDVKSLKCNMSACLQFTFHIFIQSFDTITQNISGFFIENILAQIYIQVLIYNSPILFAFVKNVCFLQLIKDFADITE